MPVVLYHGERPWPADRALTGLLDLPPVLRDTLAPHLPDFELLVDDLARRDDADIEARTRDALAVVALLLLKHGRSTPDLYPCLVRWLDHMTAAAERPGGVEALRQALYYAYQVSDLEPGRIEPLLAPRLAPKDREVIMSTAERLRAEGREEGWAKGRAEGREEGRTEERRRNLLTLLRLKFRGVSPEVEARVEAADAEVLAVWMARILTADTVEAVFGP